MDHRWQNRLHCSTLPPLECQLQEEPLRLACCRRKEKRKVVAWSAVTARTVKGLAALNGEYFATQTYQNGPERDAVKPFLEGYE